MDHDAGHMRRTLHPRRINGGTDEHCHVRLGQCGQPRTCEHRLHCRDLAERYRSAQHVIEREHTVCLAAAECRLELDHGLAVLAADASKRLHEQPRHALGHIGTRKELHGVAILERALAACDLCEVCGELGVLVPSRRHIRMRFDYVAPARQTAHGDRLQDAARIGCGCFGGRDRRTIHRASRRAIAQLAQNLADLLCTIGVDRRTETRHRIERTPCIIIGEILAAEMGKIIANTLEFFHPGAIAYRQLA